MHGVGDAEDQSGRDESDAEQQATEEDRPHALGHLIVGKVGADDNSRESDATDGEVLPPVVSGRLRQQ